jgi:hypothetical protein
MAMEGGTSGGHSGTTLQTAYFAEATKAGKDPRSRWGTFRGAAGGWFGSGRGGGPLGAVPSFAKATEGRPVGRPVPHSFSDGGVRPSLPLGKAKYAESRGEGG